MQITRCNTLTELNELASNMLISDLKENPQSLVCAATGNSPTGVYQKLVEKQGTIVVENLTFIKLDEWYGLGIDDAGSCDYYLHKNLHNGTLLQNQVVWYRTRYNVQHQ